MDGLITSAINYHMPSLSIFSATLACALIVAVQTTIAICTCMYTYRDNINST